MTTKHNKTSMADSPTGTIDRPNLQDLKRRFEEPLQQPVSEEVEQHESITGVISIKHLKPEGEDGAKEDDDSPTKGATAG